MSSFDLAFCLADDRPACEIGLRLAILSLCRHCPQTPIYVYRPPCTEEFEPWVRRFPQVMLIPHVPANASEWNCKPQALQPILAAGYRQAVWLDSDIIVTGDCRPFFMDLDDRVLAVAQEPSSLPFQGTELRTAGWGLTIGRGLRFTLNSSVLRVTKRHDSLLERWMELMERPEYITTQKTCLYSRPLHMMGDQDVLNALIGAAEFADIPVRVIRTGAEIIHTGGALGYSLVERLRSLVMPKPMFLHAAAGKPWLWLSGASYWSKRNFFSWHRRLLQELSPYVYECRSYADELGADSTWMYRRTGLGTLLRVLGLGHFAMRGLPVTAAATLIDSVRKLDYAKGPPSGIGSGLRG